MCLINFISFKVLSPVINTACAPNFLNILALLIDSLIEPTLKASVLANIKILLFSALIILIKNNMHIKIDIFPLVDVKLFFIKPPNIFLT